MAHDPVQSRISLDEVRTTAEMARLALPTADLARMAADLSSILAYVDTLAEVDVTGVEPTTHAVPLDCPLRDDVVTPHDPPESALRNAPARDGAFFAVPAIFGSGGGASSEAGEFSGESEG